MQVALPTDSLQPSSRGPEASRSLFQLAFHRFRRHKLAVISLGVLGVILLLCLGAPLFSQYAPEFIDLRARGEAPSSTHWLGTDSLGRDIWSRLLYGGRVSLIVALVAVGISLSIGVIFGLASGYYGGRADLVMQRILEIMSALPVFFVILSFVAVFGANIYNTMIIIGLLSWEGLARLVRGQTLQVRAQDFVLAARSIGAPGRGIMLNHILPNVLPYVIVWVTFAFTGVILTETALSYLGLGVQIPMPSWGNLVGAAGNLREIQFRPWTWLPAGLMITLTVLSLNFIGDALRDALDPHALID
ncbi:MAG: ABC transporter permease [Litorilinea sp.]